MSGGLAVVVGAGPVGKSLTERLVVYQWDRPFHVDASKFAARFWADATPFEQGVAETAPSYDSR